MGSNEEDDVLEKRLKNVSVVIGRNAILVHKIMGVSEPLALLASGGPTRVVFILLVVRPISNSPSCVHKTLHAQLHEHGSGKTLCVKYVYGTLKGPYHLTINYQDNKVRFGMSPGTSKMTKSLFFACKSDKSVTFPGFPKKVLALLLDVPPPLPPPQKARQTVVKWKAKCKISPTLVHG